MPDATEQSIAVVLGLVAEGRIRPEEGAELLAALEDAATVAGAGQAGTTGAIGGGGPVARDPSRDGQRTSPPSEAGRAVRVVITEDDDIVVDLRLPASLGDLALRRIPGLAEEEASRIRDALRRGMTGDIIRVGDGAGNGVRIAVE